VDDLYSLLGRLESSSVVVDLGCGRGSFHYESCRGRIVAMDVDLPADRSSSPHVCYLRADSSAIPIADSSVDAVISNHTLEHFTNYKTSLTEIGRILKPEGWIWIAVPDGDAVDDRIYRFLFEGGGHVNRFSRASLVREVESLTDTKLRQAADLFSSFIYLRRPSEDEVQHYPPRARFLREAPAGFLTFLSFGLNAFTRICDRLFRTRYSRYGWGFVFARDELRMEPMPSYFNVCRRCGSGFPAASAMKSGRGVFGVFIGKCPNCGESNVIVRPPLDLQ
jgi:SAM-dependent methyltransferase